jgi:DNA helicase-2/ATP-dependent DNA helicase PcrA
VSVGLNPSQSAAVEHNHGPLLVLAGAGSGKTRVVTERIARLIDRGVASRSILAMTFTNKAAAEMRERVVRLVGAKVAKDLQVSTFHRFGLTVLGLETRALGLRGTTFAVFDQADCSGMIKEILRELRADGTRRQSSPRAARRWQIWRAGDTFRACTSGASTSRI